MLDRSTPGSLPKFDELMRVEEQIAGLQSEDVTRSLPVVFTALGHRDLDVRVYASSALFAISLRPDSAALLKDRLGPIGDLLSESDPRLQGIATMIILNLKPAPPEAVTLLLNYLKRIDSDQDAQGSAIFTLVRIAPEKPEVVAAILQFLSRPLEKRSRIGALNALGYPGVRDARVISMVIAETDDPDQGIKLTAIQSISRMGKDAVRQARPVLQRLAEAPQETPEVQAAAKEALRQIPNPGR
jgi:hypothetical protein